MSMQRTRYRLSRILLAAATLLFLSGSLIAQEAPQTKGSQAESSKAPKTSKPSNNANAQATPPKPKLRNFTPTEQIDPDAAVSFPSDI